ncbi:MAG: CAP domain-containing protein [Halioglobus sp.]
MLDTVNAVRAQARVCGAQGSFPATSPLSWSCKLEAAALGHSMDMANNNFFSHTGSNGQSVGYRSTQATYTWSAVGENIAAGVSLSSVGAVVQAWVDSPGHCANLMRSTYTQLGASKYSNSSSTYNVYWTQVFGRPR